MTSDPDPQIDPSPEEIRLGELVDRFQGLRAEDATVGVGSLESEAGELFPELAELAECLDLLKISCGEESQEIPESFGPYRIEALLGSGVSGTVYRARREGDERKGDERKGDEQPVALKILRESLALDRAARIRFFREVEAAARVEHPHIVRFVDHGEVRERPYLAMELVECGSLADLLDRIAKDGGPGPDASWLRILDEAGVPATEGDDFAPAEAYARRMAALFAPVADAISTAARAGLIHRDLKPGNLLIARDGRLRINDFGLAKILDEEITSTVAVLGTPGFMCPEQAAGRSREVDERSDIYGLGASLYRALTLRYPVDGDSFGEVLAAIQNSVPKPVHEVCPGVPRTLSRIVDRCLQKDPRDRYQDAASLSSDLERVASGRSPRQSTIPLSRRTIRFGRRYGPPIAAAVVLLAVGLFWFTRPGEVDIRAWPGGRIEIDGRVVGQVVSPDSWEDTVSRGDHELTVARDGFHPWRLVLAMGAGESHHFDVHLRPLRPFDPATNDLLARIYDLPDAPDDMIGAARSFEEKPVPAPDGDVLDAALSRWPESERDRPEIRLLAARELLADGHPAEAYALAADVANGHPRESSPLHLALVALARMDMTDSLTYAELRELWIGLGHE